MDIEELIGHADAALYRAKKNGAQPDRAGDKAERWPRRQSRSKRRDAFDRFSRRSRRALLAAIVHSVTALPCGGPGHRAAVAVRVNGLFTMSTTPAHLRWWSRTMNLPARVARRPETRHLLGAA
jgi:hypothetical protein